MNGREPGAAGTDRRAVFSWCLFDWANSPFSTIIVTFVFSAYFAQGIVGDEIEGAFLWSQTMAAAGFAVAILSPILGAIADRGGRRKPWIALLSVGCVAATALLWFAEPDRSAIPLALVLVAVAVLCFEIATVFYNASLPNVAAPERMGRTGGWGWGAGYVGAIACLVLCLFGLVQAETPPFGLDKSQAEHVRATAIVVALWWIVFGWPYLAWVPDGARSGVAAGEAVRSGLLALWKTLRSLRDYKNIAIFLLARMIYADGLATLFQIGGLYAAGTLGMGFAEIIQFGIAMNVTAGIGAFALGWLDDRVGSRRTIEVSLVGLSVFAAAVLMVDSVLWFWVFGLALCVFVGPVQSASRTLMARLAPAHMRAEMFGLYAFSGKSTSFVGPLLFGWVTLWFDSQRAGMATILVFWLVGLVLLRMVREPARSGEG